MVGRITAVSIPERSEQRIELHMVAAPGDPNLRDDTYQAELRAAEERLRASGVHLAVGASLQKAVGASSWLTGDFYVHLTQLAPIAAPALSAVVAAWLTGRFGRKVRIKIGEVEAEAATVEEVAELLAKAKAFTAAPEKPKQP